MGTKFFRVTSLRVDKLLVIKNKLVPMLLCLSSQATCSLVHSLTCPLTMLAIEVSKSQDKDNNWNVEPQNLFLTKRLSKFALGTWIYQFKFRNQFYAELYDGVELYEVFSDGREILKAIFNEKENKFISIK